MIVKKIVSMWNELSRTKLKTNWCFFLKYKKKRIEFQQKKNKFCCHVRVASNQTKQNKEIF